MTPETFNPETLKLLIKKNFIEQISWRLCDFAFNNLLLRHSQKTKI